MSVDRDPNLHHPIPTTLDQPGMTTLDRRTRSHSWAWALGALVLALGLAAFFLYGTGDDDIGATGSTTRLERPAGPVNSSQPPTTGATPAPAYPGHPAAPITSTPNRP